MVVVKRVELLVAHPMSRPWRCWTRARDRAPNLLPRKCVPQSRSRRISNIPTVVWRPEADASTKNNVMRRGSALAVSVTILRGVRC